MDCIFKLEIAFWYLHPLALAPKYTRDILRSGCSFLWFWSLLRAWSSSKILDEKWGVGRWGLNWPTQCTDAGKAARGQSQTPTQATHGFAPTLPSIASTLIPKYPTSRRVWISWCCLFILSYTARKGYKYFNLYSRSRPTQALWISYGRE